MRRSPILLLATLALAAAGGAQPPPPGEAARRIMEQLPAPGLETLLAVEPERGLALYGELALTFGAAEGEELDRLRAYLAEVARARGRSLSERGPPYSDEEAETFLVLQLVDPPRFVGDPEFRRRATPVLHGSLDASADPELRERQLYLLARLRDFDFVAAEAVEVAWGTVARSTRPARISLDELRLTPADATGPIAGTVFSLTSRFFDVEESASLLRAVRGVAPERELVVLADRPLRSGLAALAGELRLTLIDNRGRPYSPWVRDPISLRRDPQGRLVMLLRPNVQLGREADARLGLRLLQALPEELHAAWGPVGWSVPPLPFHNGQILPLAGATWISVHSLEQRIERLLSAPRNPGPAAAAARAASELAGLYGLPPRFVHPPPGDAPQSDLAGGAGFDLDSLLTLLPGPERTTALIGDIAAGSELVADLDPGELEALGRGYGLAGSAEELRAALLAAHRRPRATGLQRFTDRIREHLEGEGLRVERLPLLLVPTDLLARREEYAAHPDFLVSWNNVVLEIDDGVARAEGFSGLLPAGDRAAEAAFAGARYRLDLLPPLVESVLRYGGYRCASNHVRAPAR